jgi:hypothetical protein
MRKDSQVKMSVYFTDTGIKGKQPVILWLQGTEAEIVELLGSPGRFLVGITQLLRTSSERRKGVGKRRRCFRYDRCYVIFTRQLLPIKLMACAFGSFKLQDSYAPSNIIAFHGNFDIVA